MWFKMKIMSTLFLFLFMIVTKSTYAICPEKCICRPINETSTRIKVKCGGTPQTKITNFKEIDFGHIRSDIIQL